MKPKVNVEGMQAAELLAQGHVLCRAEVRGMKNDTIKWVDKRTGKEQASEIRKYACELQQGDEVLQFEASMDSADAPDVGKGTVVLLGIASMTREQGRVRARVTFVQPVE